MVVPVIDDQLAQVYRKNEMLDRVRSQTRYTRAWSSQRPRADDSRSTCESEDRFATFLGVALNDSINVWACFRRNPPCREPGRAVC